MEKIKQKLRLFFQIKFSLLNFFKINILSCVDDLQIGLVPTSDRFYAELDYADLGWSECCITMGIFPNSKN
jgi:hypothetical protein